MMSKKRLINRFVRYVKVDSISRHEKKFSSMVRKELSKLGIKTVEDNAGKHIGGDCGNIFGTLKANVRSKTSIMLNAHLDTVVPGNNIKPKVRGGIITSDGTTILGADNKAGVAVIMEVLETLKNGNIPHGDIDVVFTVAEEIGLCGAKFIDRRFLKADMGFVLDGGDVDEIENKAPSQDSIEVRIAGKAAHAGVHPEDGINAIKVASDAISGMKLGRIDFETTSNIGIITGGLATNIVPDSVILKGEARSHDPKKLARQVGHMRERFVKACGRSGARLSFKVTPAYRSFEVKGGSNVVTMAVRSARAAGIKPKVRPTGGGSDANIFNSMGLRSIILGVGADKVHTNKENLKIDQMVRGCGFVLELIKESLK